MRSGSTLLRVVLDSHPDIFAPHELHLRDIDVALGSKYVERALAETGLDAEGMRFLLWDRLLHRELAASGKTQLVNKTPNDVFIADRILACWPDARFIFLLRHPGAIERSRQETRPQDTPERNAEMVRRYGDALEAARNTYPGLTIRYEDLAGDPERTTREVCAFLGLDWTPDMLEYGKFDHGRMKPGLGDWKDNIKSGRVQPPAAAAGARCTRSCATSSRPGATRRRAPVQGQRRRPGLQPGREHRAAHPLAAAPVPRTRGVRGDLRRRRLDRRDARTPRRAGRRARARPRPPHRELGLAGRRATSASRWAAATSCTSSTTTTGSARRRSSAS